MSGDENYGKRRDTWKKVFEGFDALKQTRQAEAELHRLREKAKPKKGPNTDWMDPLKVGKQKPEQPALLPPQKDYAATQELAGALQPGVSLTQLAKTEYSPEAEELRAQRLLAQENELMNGPLGKYHSSMKALTQIQPGTYDENTKTFVFQDPDKIEFEAQNQVTAALTNLVSNYSKGKNISPKGMAAIRDYLTNDLMASANEEGIVDAIVNTFTKPGSHLAGWHPSRFVDQGTLIADEIMESEAYQKLVETYVPTMAMVRTSQGLKNSLRVGKPNKDGTFSVPIEKIKDQDVGSDISTAALQGSAGFFSQTAANFMQYVPKNGQNTVPSGTLAQYLNRPTFFVEPGNTTNEDIKANILSRLDAETIKRIQEGGLDADPTLSEMVVPAAADLMGSLLFGGLKAGGTVATKGIAFGKAMLKDTKTAKRVGDLATKVIESVGKSKLVETINKTPAGAKLLGMFNGLNRTDAESALHTFLTFNFATMMESGDELTDEELTNSVISGTLFPVTGVVAGKVFAKVGQRAARLSKTIKNAKQELAVLNETSAKGLTAKQLAQRAEERVIHLSAIERTAHHYTQAGFLAGQIPANVLQGEAVRVMTDPTHQFWDDKDKVGVINDVLIGLVFGPKWFRIHWESRQGQKDFQTVYGEFVKGNQFERAVEESGKFYAKDSGETPTEAPVETVSDPIAGMPVTDMPTVEKPPEQAPVSKIYEYSPQQWSDVYGGTVQGIRKALREGRLKGRMEGEGEKKKWIIESETDIHAKPADVKPQGVFSEMPAQATVRDVVPLLNLSPENRSSKAFLEKIETVMDVPVEFNDGDEIHYDAENKKIVFGRGVQSKDLDLQRKQMTEEIAHAMTVDILADPDTRKDIKRVLEYIKGNKKVQEKILIDQVAARRAGLNKGRLQHYLKNEEEFTAAMITGELSDVAHIVDVASGEGIFSDILRKTKLGEATVFGKPVFMTPESIDNVVAGVFGKAGERVQPVAPESISSQIDEPLDTWRSAIAATGKKARGLKSEDIFYAKQLTDLTLTTGIPEQVWVKIAQEKFPDYEKWPLFLQLKHAADEGTIDRVIDPKSQLGKMLESIEAEMLNAEAQDKPVTEEQLIRNLGSFLGFTNTRNARKWIRKAVDNLGYEKAYEKMTKRFEKHQKGMPDDMARAFRQTFDKVYSHLMLSSGWTDMHRDVEVKLIVDDDDSMAVSGVRVLPEKSHPHKSGYVTAMKMLTETMRGDWNKPLHTYFMDALMTAEVATATNLGDAARKLESGKEEQIDNALMNEGWYVLPKGYQGAMLLNIDGLMDALSLKITEKHQRTPSGTPMMYDKAVSKSIVKSLESMIWHRALGGDSRWDVGEKVDVASGNYKGLDFHKLLDEWRTYGQIKSDVMDLFSEKGEMWASYVQKNKDALRGDLTKIARKLDAVMMSSKSRLEPLSKLYDTQLDKVLPEGQQNKDLVKFYMKWAMAKVLDQVYGLSVDPGAKSFHEDIKMPAKYLGHMTGTSYHAFKDASHVDAVLKWTGRKPITFKGNLESQEAIDHRRYLESLGLHMDSEGNPYHKVLVINDDQAAQMPELLQLFGKERASKVWDGASFYINPETEALHAEMLGNERDNTGGIKFAWYGNDRGHVNMWKTAGSESLLDVMSSLEDMPQVAAMLHKLRSQGISMITVESALKSDGSFRYRHETDEDGSGSLLYNDKGRVVGEVSSTGEHKKYSPEDIAAIHADQGQKLALGEFSQGNVLNVPLTGENGLRLILVSKGLDKLNGVAAGINNIPSTLPGDVGNSAYVHLSHVIANRNQAAAEVFNAGTKISSMLQQKKASGGWKLNLVQDKALADVYDGIRSMLERDNSPMGETYFDSESRRILLDRYDALVDAEGNMSPNRLKAFDVRYPGVFSQPLASADPYRNKSLLQRVGEDAVGAAKRVRYDGSSGMMLQPMTTPKHYLSLGQEYIDRLVQSGTISEAEGTVRMTAIEDVMYNGGLLEDGRGGSIELPPLFAEDGTLTPNNPYVFVTQDYLDLANRHVKRYNARQTDPSRHLEAVLPGSKVIGVLTPTDSLESNVPMVIAGVMPGVGRVAANDQIMRMISGRDFDADKWGLAFKSEIWEDTGGSNHYDDFWSEMYNSGVLENITKKNIETLQEGKAASEQEAQGSVKNRAMAQDQSLVPYHYTPQRPQDTGYHKRAMQTSIGIDKAMDMQRKLTSAMRTTIGMNTVSGGSFDNSTAFGLVRDKDKNRVLKVGATFVHDPEMSSQLSMWKQSLVDPYDAYSYELEDVLLASVAKNITVDGEETKFADLTSLEKDGLRRALQSYMNSSKYISPNSAFMKMSQASELRDQSQDMRSRIVDAKSFFNLNNMREGQDYQYMKNAGSTVNKSVRTHPLNAGLTSLLKKSGFDQSFKDWNDAIFKRGNKETSVYGNALVPPGALEEIAVNRTIQRSFLNSDRMVASDGGKVVLTERLALVGTESEGMFQFKDSEGNVRDEIPVATVFDSKGNVVDDYKTVLEAEGITNIDALQKPEVWGRIVPIRMVDTGGNIKRRALADPQNLWINFDNGTWKGQDRDNQLWVSKAGIQGSPDAMRQVDKLGAKVLAHLERYPDGFIYFNHNYGSDREAQQKASLAEGAVREAVNAHDAATGKNTKGFFKPKKLEIQERADLAGEIAAAFSQHVTDDPVQQAMVAGKLIAESIDARYSDATSVQHPDIQSWFKGSFADGVIPRHPSGIALDEMYYAVMSGPSDAFTKFRESLSQEKSTVSHDVSTPPEIVDQLGAEKRPKTFDTFSSAERKEGFEPTQALVDALGKSRKQRLSAMMENLRVATNGNMTSITPEEYAKVFDDVKSVYKTMFNGRLEEKHIEALVNTLNPGIVERLYQDLHAYGEPTTRKTSLTTAFVQLFDVGERFARDLSKVVNTSKSDLRKKWALRFENFLKLNKQNDEELVRLTSNFPVFANREEVLGVAVHTFNGEPVSITPMTVGQMWNPYYQVRENVIYDAAPNIHYLKPQSDIHSIKDAFQVSLNHGSQDIAGLDTPFVDKRSFKDYMLEDFKEGRFDPDRDDLSADMRLLKDLLNNGEIDFGDFKIDSEFDGVAEARSTITYNGKTFVWNGVLGKNDKTVIDELINDMAGNIPIKNQTQRDGLARSLRRSIMMMAHDKMLANYVQAMAQKHHHWLSSQSRHWHSEASEFNEVSQLVSQNLAKMEELANDLRSDKLQDHIAMTTAVSPRVLGDRLTRFMEIVQSMEPGARDIAYANIMDVVNRAYDQEATDFAHEASVLTQAEKGRNIVRSVLNHVNESDVVFRNMFPNENIAVPDYIQNKRDNPLIEAHLNEFLADFFGEQQDYGMKNRYSLLKTEAERLMFGINDAMKTAYMHEYGMTENPFARAAILSRFDTNGMYYETKHDLSRMHSLSASMLGGTLTEAHHGIKAGESVSVQYRDKEGNIRKSNGRFLGVTGVTPTQALSAVAEKTAEELSARGSKITPEELAFLDAAGEHMDKKSMVPALLFSSISDETQKGQVVLVPLDRTVSLATGKSLSGFKNFFESKSQEHTQRTLDGLAEGLKEVSSMEGQDPLKALAGQITQRMVVDPNDRTFTTGSIALRKPSNKQKPTEQVFVEKMGFDELPAGWRGLKTYLEESNKLVSRYTYGGLRHVVGITVGAGIVAAAPLTAIPMVTALAGGILMGKSLTKGAAAHTLHFLGNRVGGPMRAYMLDLPGASLSKAIGSMFSGTRSSPVGAAAIAQRLQAGSQFLGDQFADPNESINRPTASLERHVEVLKYLRDIGLDEQVFAGKSASEIKTLMYEAVKNASKHADGYKVQTVFDPETQTTKSYLVDQDGMSLTELERLNIDAFNQALTFVDHDAEMTLKGAFKLAMQAGTTGFKKLNKVNTRAFKKVTDSEYEGAVKLSSQLEDSYMQLGQMNKLPEFSHEAQEVEKLLKVNYIKAMSTEILGKFDEKNPYHTTQTGKLATLFSQWTRNFFLQTTTGISHRQELFREITKTLANDPEVSRRMKIMGIPTMGGVAKSQATALTKLSIVGGMGNIHVIARVAAYALASMGVVAGKDIRDLERYLQESVDSQMQSLNRLVGSDNVQGYIAAGAATVMAEILLYLNRGSKAVTDAREYKAGKLTTEMLGKIVTAPGYGVTVQAIERNAEMVALGSYLWAIDASPKQWERFEKDLQYLAQSTATSSGVGVVAGMGIESTRNVLKAQGDKK